MNTSILVAGRVGQVGREIARGNWPVGLWVDFVERPRGDPTRPEEAQEIVSRLDCGKIARVYSIEAPRWQDSLSAVLDELFAAAVPTEAAS